MQPNERENQQRTRGGQLRFAALGLEFGGGIAGCVLLGYWVDQTFATGHWGVIGGAVLGCVGGMYRLITTAWRWQKQQSASDESGFGRIRHDDNSGAGD